MATSGHRVKALHLAFHAAPLYLTRIEPVSGRLADAGPTPAAA